MSERKGKEGSCFIEFEKRPIHLSFPGSYCHNQTHYLNWGVPGDFIEDYLGTWDLKCHLESLKLGYYLVKPELRDSHICAKLQGSELITSGRSLFKTLHSLLFLFLLLKFSQVVVHFKVNLLMGKRASGHGF